MTYVLLEQYAKHHEHVHINALSQAGYFDINITTHTMHREQVLSQTFKSRFTWLNHARSDWHRTWCHHNCNTITWPFHVEIAFFHVMCQLGFLYTCHNVPEQDRNRPGAANNGPILVKLLQIKPWSAGPVYTRVRNLVITVPADVLVPIGARSSADTLVTDYLRHVYLSLVVSLI